MSKRNRRRRNRRNRKMNKRNKRMNRRRNRRNRKINRRRNRKNRKMSRRNRRRRNRRNRKMNKRNQRMNRRRNRRNRKMSRRNRRMNRRRNRRNRRVSRRNKMMKRLFSSKKTFIRVGGKKYRVRKERKTGKYFYRTGRKYSKKIYINLNAVYQVQYSRRRITKCGRGRRYKMINGKRRRLFRAGKRWFYKLGKFKKYINLKRWFRSGRKSGHRNSKKTKMYYTYKGVRYLLQKSRSRGYYFLKSGRKRFVKSGTVVSRKHFYRILKFGSSKKRFTFKLHRERNARKTYYIRVPAMKRVFLRRTRKRNTFRVRYRGRKYTVRVQKNRKRKFKFVKLGRRVMRLGRSGKKTGRKYFFRVPSKRRTKKFLKKTKKQGVYKLKFRGKKYTIKINKKTAPVLKKFFNYVLFNNVHYRLRYTRSRRSYFFRNGRKVRFSFRFRRVTRKCRSGKKLLFSKFLKRLRCQKYDYCAKRRCKHDAKCNNERGGFFCSCPKDMMYDREFGCQKIPNLGNGCKAKADVVFIVDSSGSVGYRNFQKVKRFVKNVVSKFKIGRDATRVSIVRFNSRVFFEFGFNKYSSKSKLQKAIRRIRYTGGGTNTAKALKYTRLSVLTKANKKTPTIVVVITDGRSSSRKWTIRQANAIAKDKSVTLYSVGIGSRLDVRELKAMASSPSSKHSFVAKSFNALNSIYLKLASKACASSCPRGSKCISCKAGQYELNGVCYHDSCATPQCVGNSKCVNKRSSFLCTCPAGLIDSRTKLGCVKPTTNLKSKLVMYTQAGCKGKAKTIFGADADLGKFGSRVRSVKSFGPRPWAGYGQRNFEQHFLWGKEGKCKNVRSKFILASVRPHGHSILRCPSGFRRVNRKCVDINECLIKGICKGKDAICTNYRGWWNGRYACSCPLGKIYDERLGCVRLPNLGSGCNTKADVSILLDASSSVGRHNFKKMKKFAAEIVNMMNVSPKSFRFNLISFSTKAYNVFSFNKYSNKKSMIKAIMKTKYKHGGTATYDALNLLRKEFKKARKNVPKVAIVVTDGRSMNAKKTIRAAAFLKKQKVIAFSIGIGRHLNMKELKAIATAPSDEFLFRARSFKDLIHIQTKIAKKTCEKTCVKGDCVKCKRGFMKKRGTCVKNYCAIKGICKAGSKCILKNLKYECTCPKKGMDYDRKKGCVAAAIEEEDEIQVLPAQIPETGIVFYERPNFKGRSITVIDDIPDMSKVSFDNSAESAIIYGDKKWAIYDRTVYRKELAILSEGKYPVLKKIRANDRVSSVRDIPEVEKHCESSPCSAGAKCSELTDGYKCTCKSNLFEYNTLKGCVKTVVVEPRSGVVLYNQPNFKGKFIILNKNVPKLNKYKFGKTVKSIKVIGKKTWTVYDEENYLKPLAEFPAGEYPKLPTDNKLFSLRVSPKKPELKNHCAKNTCLTKARCINLKKSHKCVCRLGFRYNAKKGCRKIVTSPCDSRPCRAAKCIRKGLIEYRCKCRNGRRYSKKFACRKPRRNPIRKENEDEKYFAPMKYQKPKPKSLGMESYVISDKSIKSSSQRKGNEAKLARPNKSGWRPRKGDRRPYIQADIGDYLGIHGVGTKGTPKGNCFVKRYVILVSKDGKSFKPLLKKNSRKVKVWRANKDTDSWKHHCLHRYYGKPIKARFVRLVPRKSKRCVGMRFELFGFRNPEDPKLLKKISKDIWTEKSTGCQCYFDHTRFDCACCNAGGCQCSNSNRHQCVQCGYGSKCGVPVVEKVRDPWTKSKGGCACGFDPTKKDCACCENGGCQCGKENKDQCVQCGQTKQCGAGDNSPAFCKPRTCPMK